MSYASRLQPTDHTPGKTQHAFLVGELLHLFLVITLSLRHTWFSQEMEGKRMLFAEISFRLVPSSHRWSFPQDALDSTSFFHISRGK